MFSREALSVVLAIAHTPGNILHPLSPKVLFQATCLAKFIYLSPGRVSVILPIGLSPILLLFIYVPFNKKQWCSISLSTPNSFFFIVIINFSDTLAMPIIEVGGLKIGTGFS